MSGGRPDSMAKLIIGEAAEAEYAQLLIGMQHEASLQPTASRRRLRRLSAESLTGPSGAQHVMTPTGS